MKSRTMSERASGSAEERIARYRARVGAGRQRGRDLFDREASGIEVARVLSQEIDAFVVELIDDILSSLEPAERDRLERNSAVIAVGGSGRGELAPWSDTDLLFLYTGAAGPAQAYIAQIVRDCWDAGLKLGHSVRTIRDALGMARHDPHFATAAIEARLIRGSRPIFDQFRNRYYRKVIQARRKAFVNECTQAREIERLQHGSTVHELNPDVKRSLGGLRDLHLLRWIGFAHYGTAELDKLCHKKALDPDDARRLAEAHEFLLQVRADLHFHAERAQDVLSRDEQLRISRDRNIEAESGLRPVERFMQTYFRHTTAVAEIVQGFVARHRPSSLGSRLIGIVTSRRADELFRIGPGGVDVVDGQRQSICEDARQVLRLFGVTARTGIDPSGELMKLIEQAVPRMRNLEPVKCSEELLNLFGLSGHLGRALRGLYRVRLLERLVPALAHARCLLQFNDYHSYTVDEHSFRAVEAAEAFQKAEGPLGQAYRSIADKPLLHLALLLHDLGKGFEEDHSEVSRRIAARMAERLGLPESRRDTLVFLVHRHLLMAHLAFRRDITDPQTVVQFSREVGSPETLRMLYVLTAADLTAVGPGKWTDWKSELLADLYDRALLVLSGESYRDHEQQRLRDIRRTVRTLIAPRQSSVVENSEHDERADGEPDWYEQQLADLPTRYFSSTDPQRIVADLGVLRHLARRDVFVEGHNDPETATVEYRIIAPSGSVSGCFHKTAGVLTAKRMEILSARINRGRSGTVIDSYCVLDNDFRGRIPPARIDEVTASIRQALTEQTAVEQLFQRHMRFGESTDVEPISDLPMRVAIDNNTSEVCTIIDVFAHDRPGLLYSISRAINELGLAVQMAKIATHLDQVVDVFYVTDDRQQKIDDPQRLKTIRAELAARIEEFERHEYRLFVS